MKYVVDMMHFPGNRVAVFWKCEKLKSDVNTQLHQFPGSASMVVALYRGGSKVKRNMVLTTLRSELDELRPAYPTAGRLSGSQANPSMY